MDKPRLTIELYERNRGGSRVASSELEFKESDPKEERWASAGVVVAALVLAQPAEQNDTRAGAARAPVAPEPSTFSRCPSRDGRLGCAWIWALREAVRRWRLGPFGRFGVAFADVPLFAFFSAAYTFGASDGTTRSRVVDRICGRGRSHGLRRGRRSTSEPSWCSKR